MRDDLCTLTNAYPDHENVQGPTGMDVARVMTELIPRGNTVLTAEEQMLPVLRDAARARGARLLAVGWRDVELLPEDLLARFPYSEHPRNIALVLALAAELGVERDVALKEMADWIVPDLGVLKTYPEAQWRGRRLEFSNGMSANERTGFLGNWSRLGFGEPSPDEPGPWTVIVVNNRGDRNARSAVFADIIARDVAAHRHVIIGTNVRGFARRAEAAYRDGPGEGTLFARADRVMSIDDVVADAFARAERVLTRLHVGALGPARLAREARDMASGLGLSGTLVEDEVFEPVLASVSSHGTTAEPLDVLRARLGAALRPRLGSYAVALGEPGAEAVAHLVELAARHAAVLGWRARAPATLARLGLARGRAVVERDFRALATSLFRASLVVVGDPATSGDQVVDLVARATPPGFRARVLGAQNIKGTGLDFAYRWVALERTHRSLVELQAASDDGARALAFDLLARDDLGILDCAAAATALRARAARVTDGAASGWTDVLARLETRQATAVAALGGRAKDRPVLGRVERILDVWDGVLRKARAGRLMDELVEGRRSHAEVATAMRALAARQKGGWLGARGRRAQ
jgi:hypothetical protein